MGTERSYPHPLISQVELVVQNLDQTLDFYTGVLGFQVLEKSAKKAALTADGKTALLALEQDEGAILRNQRTTGLYHIAFLLPDRSDLADIINHFIRLRYPLQGASDHYVSEALYLADPEGNGIEIYTDRPAHAWKWEGDQVFMTTQALDVEDVLKEASGAGWERMPARTVIGHIHLQVSDLQDTKRFYCEGLGFDPVLNYGSQALFVSKDRYHHHIGLNTWNSRGASAPPENSTGLKWFDIMLPNEEERNKVVRQLKDAGAWVSEENDPILTKDPSGIFMRLQV
ncbi:MAG TPA: VOC family protein [Bacillaceae bacterium]